MTADLHNQEAVGRPSCLGVIWQGAFFAHHSFANVNREVAGLLARRRGVDLGLAVDGPELPDGAADAAEGFLARCIGHRPPTVHCHVRHRWPPDFSRPQGGGFVLVQPWEFTQLPTAWVEALQASVDEVWTPSAFSRDAFVASGVDDSKVAVVPWGVNPEVFNPQAAPWPLSTRAGFRFLFVGGTIERKGFDLLLRAYVDEFSRDDDVCLVVKDFFYGGHAGAVVRDLAGRPGAPEIHYSYGTTAPEELGGLFTACDSYVQPYRGEGFGLPIVEAMACGLPAIVTGAGPALEYCTDDTAYLVDASEVPVPAEIWSGSLPTGAPPAWYEPDLDHLRRLLRHVYEHRDEARTVGALSSRAVLQHHTWSRTVDQVVARLERLAVR